MTIIVIYSAVCDGNIVTNFDFWLITVTIHIVYIFLFILCCIKTNIFFILL